MATGQTLLDLMQVMDNELHNQPTEEDVVRSLIALNAAQDLFESVVAGHPNLYGDTVGTVAITAGAESTAFPTNVLRLDRLRMMQDGRPTFALRKLDDTGGNASVGWWYGASPTANGRVNSYWTDGRNIYWSPFPSQADTVRWYGFQSAADITAAGTFAYNDIALLPIAGFAVKLMRAGVGDDTVDLNEATAVFVPVVKQLANFNRDRASVLLYKNVHTT